MLKLVEKYNRNLFIEFAIVFILSGIVSWPILSVDYFVTHEGAAHLYNADILIDLLFKKDFYHNFFELNSEPEPNLMGHALLILLRFVFNPLYAEKLIALTGLIALVFAIRYFLKVSFGLINWFYLSAFLLGYNYIFVLGFYNFILSISVFFFACGWFVSIHNKLNVKNLIVFIVLSLVLYFSHIFSYLLFVIFISIFSVVRFREQNFKKRLQAIEFLFWTQLIPLIFIVNYFIKKSSGEEIFWTWQEKFNYLYKLSTLVNFAPEIYYGHIWVTRLFFLLAVLFLTGWVIYQKQGLRNQVFLLIFLLVIVLLYFMLPNTSAGGGYISDRFALYIFLFVVAGLSSIQVSGLFNLFFAVGVLIVSVWGTKQNTLAYKNMNNDIKELMLCEDKINNGAVVLPVVFQKNWLYGHASNYLSLNKKIVLLENYEASQGYFPVLWKEDKLPIIHLPLIFNEPTSLDFNGYYHKSGLRVNYVLVWDNLKPGNNVIYNQMLDKIKTEYKLIYHNQDYSVQLFSLN